MVRRTVTTKAVTTKAVTTKAVTTKPRRRCVVSGCLIACFTPQQYAAAVRTSLCQSLGRHSLGLTPGSSSLQEDF